MSRGYDRKRINAVVMLSDGYNEDDQNNDRPRSSRTCTILSGCSRSRIHPTPICSTLRRIAQATDTARV